jgi:phosphate-selective porin
VLAPAPTSTLPAPAPSDPLAPAAASSKDAAAAPTAAGTKTGDIAGWNGEHFFIGSRDGEFQLTPLGFFNENYAVYPVGDGAPPNGFSLNRARFGFEGRAGKQIDYTVYVDAASTGVVLRDAFVTLKPFKALQFRIGQFKELFSQEVGTWDNNIGFSDRSLVAALYPSATGSFRSPGAMLFGSVADGLFEYWVGAFDGRGLLNPATSDWPEIVGRLRISPLRWTGVEALSHLSFGAAYGFGRSVALSKDVSFSGALSDGAYTFFPSFLINGPIQRFGFEFMWLLGPLGVHGGYAELHQARDSVGSGALEGAGFESFPDVVGRGAYGQVTVFLTGEKEEEFSFPKVRHPLIGPPTPGTEGGLGAGAFQLAARFAWLSGNAPGASFATFSPSSVPTYVDDTEQITAGVHWHLNYWVIHRLDVNIDKLNEPSVQGSLPQIFVVVVQQIQIRF